MVISINKIKMVGVNEGIKQLQEALDKSIPGEGTAGAKAGSKKGCGLFKNQDAG